SPAIELLQVRSLITTSVLAAARLKYKRASSNERLPPWSNGKGRAFPDATFLASHQNLKACFFSHALIMR
ncbi:MAG: hypothetical protein RIQ36_1203, partial [Pseudomonadota bacterium]